MPAHPAKWKTGDTRFEHVRFGQSTETCTLRANYGTETLHRNPRSHRHRAATRAEYSSGGCRHLIRPTAHADFEMFATRIYREAELRPGGFPSGDWKPGGWAPDKGLMTYRPNPRRCGRTIVSGFQCGGCRRSLRRGTRAVRDASTGSGRPRTPRCRRPFEKS